MMVTGSGPDDVIHTEYNQNESVSVKTETVLQASCEHRDRNLLQQLVVSEAEGFLQQDGQHHTEDEETFLLCWAVLVTDLN